MSEFEKLVRHALIDNNMSMSQLAEKLGISVSYAYELIKGSRKNEEQKAKMKDVLGITEDV